MSKELVHSPADVSKKGVESIRDNRENPFSGIRTGIEGLDNDFLTPWRPQIITVEAYTNHGKTLFMTKIAENVETTCKDNEVVVFIDLENSLEESTVSSFGRVAQIPIEKLLTGNIKDDEWRRLMQAATQRATKKIWLVAYSEQAYKDREPVSIATIHKALSYITVPESEGGQGKKIKLIVLDYFHQLEVPMGMYQLRFAYKTMMRELETMALGFGCPLLLGAQAGRGTQSRQNRIPTLADLQETSAIEQTSRTVISLYMPAKDFPINSIDYEYGGKSFKVTYNLLMVSVLKQKHGRCPITRAFDLNYDTLELTRRIY